jgi:hypothetical protein
MPLALAIMRWDERVGMELIGKYPPEFSLENKDLMQIYFQHESSGDQGFVTFSSGPTNIASFYTGNEFATYFVLFLTALESGEAYEEGLSEIGREYLMNSDFTQSETKFAEIYRRLSIHPSLTGEQKLAMINHNKIKRMILDRFREDIFIIKSELDLWLKDSFRTSFMDTDTLVNEFVKNKLVKMTSVKKFASDILVMTNDILALRTPPAELVKNPGKFRLPSKFHREYSKQVHNFFQAYHPDDKDTNEVLEKIILDPATYEVLKLLRLTFATQEDLEKLRRKGVDDIPRVIQALKEKNILIDFKDDNGKVYYGLMSDFTIQRFVPEYCLDILREQYRRKAQNPEAIVNALQFLRDEYLHHNPTGD